MAPWPPRRCSAAGVVFDRPSWLSHICLGVFFKANQFCFILFRVAPWAPRRCSASGEVFSVGLGAPSVALHLVELGA